MFLRSMNPNPNASWASMLPTRHFTINTALCLLYPMLRITSLNEMMWWDMAPGFNKVG